MANFKHKVFLLIAKWIPVAVAAGILINNTLAMLDVKDVILDLFDITVGSSLAFVIMMYACSYVFNFYYWHKIVITYDLFVLSYILLIRYTNIGECSDGLLLTIHYILAGIFIALIMYHTNNKGVKIDTPLFSIENAKKIYDRRIRPLNKDVTMWDVYVALNAQYHDNIDLYEKWFSNANDSEIEEKIIEATIANWFEDEDASSDKVWEYFRVI